MIKNLHTTIKLLYNPFTGKLIKNSNPKVFKELVKNFFPKTNKLSDIKTYSKKNVKKMSK